MEPRSTPAGASVAAGAADENVYRSSLAAALGYVRTGGCAGSSTLAAQENARREAAPPRQARRYGFRQLVNAY